MTTMHQFTVIQIKYKSKKDIKSFSIREIIAKDCKKISDAPPGTYVDLNDPGCDGKVDTKFIPHSTCKGFGKPPDSESQKIIKKGTQTSDVVCGPCRCPEGYIGSKPKCNGSNIDENDLPLGCTKNILCKKCYRPGVKASTVMYGSSLPASALSTAASDFPVNVDLLIIIGT